MLARACILPRVPGVLYATNTPRFGVPEDKLAKLETIPWRTMSDGYISFTILGKLAGKGISVKIAIPTASLYTKQMYAQVASYTRTGWRGTAAIIVALANEDLYHELEMWLEVCPRMNGASWDHIAQSIVQFTGDRRFISLVGRANLYTRRYLFFRTYQLEGATQVAPRRLSQCPATPPRDSRISNPYWYRQPC